MVLDYYQSIRTDSSNPFANYTMRERLPEVVQSVIDNNPTYSEAILQELSRLKKDIVRDAPLPSPEPDWWDFAEWQYHRQQHKGATWLNTEWMFAETYLYRCIMHITRYWEFGCDPFQSIKYQALTEDTVKKVLSAGFSLSGPEEERFAGFIGLSLWGNRMDLSYKTSMAHGTELLDEDDLLINQTEEAYTTVREKSGDIHLVTDNTGSELIADLMLADFFIRSCDATTVLHVKFYPTYVSDATPKDVVLAVEQMITQPKAHIKSLGKRLRGHLTEKRLRLVPHPFWNSPGFLFNLPDNLASLFSTARLVMFKGDLNYRRMVKDAILPTTLSFSETAAYFPSPVLMLRCLKSDPIVGLPSGKAEQLDTIDTQWRTNGKRGIIQFRGAG